MRHRGTQKMTLSKYQIEKVEGSRAVAYRLIGTRGSVIRLVRNQANPELMYAINKNGAMVSLDGSEYFSDKTGMVQPVAVRF